MRWGLLAGIGAGLSQGSQMVSQGMAEDRAVRRAEELERMREASFERRWKQQIQREDQLRGEDKAQRANERAEDKALRQQERTDDMKWRQSESNRQAGQFDRQMTQREKQVIEQNLTGIMEQEARAAERIQQRYQKLMADGMGDTAAMQAQMAAELEANQMFYSERLHSMIQSYGPQGLSGTGFEYLLSVEQPEADKPGTGGAADPGVNRSDEIRKLTQGWLQPKTPKPATAAFPQPTKVDPMKAALIKPRPLLDGVMPGDFNDFTNWLNTGRN